MVSSPQIELLNFSDQFIDALNVIFPKGQNELAKSFPKFPSELLDFLFPVSPLMSYAEDPCRRFVFQ